jgi:hypothetical protein
MAARTLFEGEAARTELIVLMLEKWGLHPRHEETTAQPDLDDLERPARVMIPDTEYERAREILFGESELDRGEF